MQCVQCDAALIPGKPFCHECGRPVHLACSNCGSAIKPGFRFCPDCGTALAQDAGAAPAPADRFARLSQHIPRGLVDKIRTSKSSISGERKLVTVLFCDLVGSTAIAERIDPEEYHELLEQYLELAFAEIYRVDGIVNQLAGDGMMALFGAPVAHENAPQRAVHAALAIRSALDRFNEKRGGESSQELQIRIGINTGPVVVGTVGNDLKMDYTAIGDTTNLASRMQSLAEPDSILVSETTHRLVRGLFQARKVGPFEVKGKREPISAYEIVGVSDTVTPMAIAEARGLTPLVGRSAELAQLRSCYERLIGNQAQVVAVTGEAGSGKSRLIYEFKQRISREEAVFFEARCSPLTRMLPYAPWSEMFSQFFELKRDERPEVAVEKVTSKLDELQADAEQICPYICRLLSIPVDGLEDLSPDEIRRRTFDAITRIGIAVSRRKPMVMFIEDLQWIDEASLELLELALAKMQKTFMMLVISYRPDYQPAWRTQASFTQINLSSLDDSETREMITSIAGGTLPAELERRILVKAEGNPFFTEELTRGLVDEGYLVPGNGEIELTRPVGEIQIPDTVQDLIAARLDRLGANAKRVVQVASVIGRQFRTEHLVSMLSGEEIDAPAELEMLEQIGIVHRKHVLSNEEFRFGESLTQEVAYESLLHKELRQLHERIGLMLESAAGEDGSPEATALTAHHFARGENRQKAVEALLRAGHQAEAIPAYRASVDFFKKAWELAEELLAEGDADEGRRRWVMQAALGFVRVNVLHASRDELATEKVGSRGVALARELGDREAVAAFHSFRGMDLMARDRKSFPAGLALVEESFTMMRDAGLTIGRVRAARAMGWSYLLDGRFEKAKATMAWALGELEKSESVTTLSDIYVAIRWMQGAIDLYSDDYETAEKRLVETYDLAMKAPNLTVQTSTATNIAQLHFQRGEYAKSKEWGERSLAMAREIGHLSALWSAAVITMVSCVELGETDSLEEYMALIEEGVEGGTTIFMSTHLIGQALLATGEIARARRIAALAEVRVGGRLREVYTNLALGDVLHQDGRKNWDEALRHYDNALNGARQIALRSAEGAALLGMARLSLDKGEREAARESARTARDLLEALDHRHGVARADAVLRQLGEGAQPGA